MNRDTSVPTYHQLLERTDAPAGSSWNLFGAEDELGTLNFLTPEKRRQAATLVQRGASFSLDLPLDAFEKPLIPHRGLLQHSVFGLNEHHRDDRIDNLFPQATSQIDGLRHFGHPDFGFYNGMDPQKLIAGDPTLGVQRYAEYGISGRGVLLDIGAYLEKTGDPLDYSYNRALPVSVLDKVAEHQDVQLEAGDILLLRFGWVGDYLKRQEAGLLKDGEPLLSVGFEANQETAAWFWDHQIAMAAADNVALEAWPPNNSAITTKAEETGELALSSHTGMLHRLLIPMLGLAIGELWNLDALAADCHADHRYEVMVVANPLRLPGGVGSTANAVALK